MESPRSADAEIDGFAAASKKERLVGGCQDQDGICLILIFDPQPFKAAHDSLADHSLYANAISLYIHVKF